MEPGSLVFSSLFTGRSKLPLIQVTTCLSTVAWHIPLNFFAYDERGDMCHLQTANLEGFDIERSISLVPSDGEFALATYRASHAITPPYRLQVNVESDAASEYKVCLADVGRVGEGPWDVQRVGWDGSELQVVMQRDARVLKRL
jgi:hypothetical protein